MAEEREPTLENAVWRLEQRQQDALATLGEHKAQLEGHDKQLAEMASRLQWLEWQRQEERDQTKALLPLAERVAAVDPELLRMVIGAILSAALGMMGANFAFGSG